MSGKETDDKIQKITRLLEKGGTMLATHHECGAPMFRFQGKTVCPVCDFQEKQESKKQEMKGGQEERKDLKKEQEPQDPLMKTQKPQKPEISASQISCAQEISSVITSKIRDIAGTLETETDISRVREKMDCIEQGIRILQSLKD
ncbi:MAG: Sjogren's syndrome/scleroderma autoantigen 1 family protein [Candidatus Methanoperedens sp.]|nr:Sjogren's syndrome/scleroderma autoantigen 1 family protein [Candidatus Methanoperedens sp.]